MAAGRTNRRLFALVYRAGARAYWLLFARTARTNFHRNNKWEPLRPTRLNRRPLLEPPRRFIVRFFNSTRFTLMGMIIFRHFSSSSQPPSPPLQTERHGGRIICNLRPTVKCWPPPPKPAVKLQATLILAFLAPKSIKVSLLPSLPFPRTELSRSRSAND